MDANKILQADVLDIIFEKRNKEYGAYDLRKTYNKRLTVSIITMVSLLSLLFGGYLLAGNFGKNNRTKIVQVKDVELMNVPPEKDPLPPTPPPKIDPPKVETIKLTPPRIVPDNDVKKEEMPPENKDVETAKIGNFNQKGEAFDGTESPVDIGKGIVSTPKKVDNSDDDIFRKVEIESSYVGGADAWSRYLNKTLHYPDEAINNEIQGTVIVQFIVDKEGNISDVQAVSGPDAGGLREEAIRVIKKSGKWTPAIQNGREVKSYKKQPIVFKMNTE